MKKQYVLVKQGELLEVTNKMTQRGAKRKATSEGASVYEVGRKLDFNQHLLTLVAGNGPSVNITADHDLLVTRGYRF